MKTPSTVDWLADLVARPTISRTSNLGLVERIESYLNDLGVAVRRTTSEDGTRANLFASIGPERSGGVVLSGHTDVVPVEGQAWTREPFALSEHGGRLYGRGTSDMKGFIAAVLGAVPGFLERDLARPIHLSFTYDEEVGCIGVHRLLEDLASASIRPEMAIVGEPTSMRLATAHKGIRVFRTRIRGRPAHSSLPQRGANAIMAAGQLIEFLRRMAAEIAERGGHDAFDPPYTTVNVGLISGGAALNIVAEACDFTWEYRPVPDSDEEEIIRAFRRTVEEDVLPALVRQAPEARIETEVIAGIPAFQDLDDNPAEDLVRRLSGANGHTFPSFVTEAGLFREAGMRTVVFGPGSIEQAHTPDEYIEVSQLEDYAGFLERLGDWAGRD